jgi:hypothetical protein
MPYDKTNWQDFPSTATPLDAEALNKLETQYDEAIADQTPVTHTFSHTGAVTVKTGTHRLYNDTGSNLSILLVRAVVGTAPTGASLIVDVHKNDTTIFTTQSNRPTITASSFTDTSVPAVALWSAGEYLTVDIDQVGSTVAGSDLVVTVIAHA